MFYSAAWTECGRFMSCWHEHKTVVEAASCIPCAGGYVVGVENGAMRSLKAEEESEFQCAVSSDSTNNPAAETTPAAPAEAAVSDTAYAVMTRIRVGNGWTWTTWVRLETYAEAAAHAREGNDASPRVTNAPRQSISPRGEGETLVDFVLQVLSAYGISQATN